jgi:hypothetical protein
LPKCFCSELSGACQVYCFFRLACDVADFKAYMFNVYQLFAFCCLVGPNSSLVAKIIWADAI